jgi:hypothetical protein
MHLTPEEFKEQFRRLENCLVNPNARKDPGHKEAFAARAQEYYEIWKEIPGDALVRVITRGLKTWRWFPTAAEVRDLWIETEGGPVRPSHFTPEDLDPFEQTLLAEAARLDEMIETLSPAEQARLNKEAVEMMPTRIPIIHEFKANIGGPFWKAGMRQCRHRIMCNRLGIRNPHDAWEEYSNGNYPRPRGARPQEVRDRPNGEGADNPLRAFTKVLGGNFGKSREREE